MDTKQHDEMMARIKRHGDNLNRIFETGLDPVTLCKKLRRLELQAQGYALDYCNGEIDLADMDLGETRIMLLLGKIIPPDKIAETGIFLNRDPRGYALKLSVDWTRGYVAGGGKIHRDMGGYGILAPDLSERD